MFYVAFQAYIHIFFCKCSTKIDDAEDNACSVVTFNNEDTACSIVTKIDYISLSKVAHRPIPVSTSMTLTMQ